MLEKMNNFIFFAEDVNRTPLDLVMEGYLVRIILLLIGQLGQQALASNWRRN
jgi:hypothetical protein